MSPPFETPYKGRCGGSSKSAREVCRLKMSGFARSTRRHTSVVSLIQIFLYPQKENKSNGFHKKIGILEGVSGFKDGDLFTVPMDKLLSCFHFATASFLSESPSKYVLAEGENTLRASVPWALLPKPEAFWNRETFCVHASPRRAYSQKGFRPDSERGRQSPKTGPEHPRGL